MRSAQKTARLKPAKRHAMATPIKDSKSPKERIHSIGGWIKTFISFIRRRVYFGVALFLFVFLIYIIFFTSFFTVQTYAISLDKSNGCLSEAFIRNRIVVKNAKIWSYFILNTKSLYSSHKCLNKILFKWNPFHFNTLSIEVFSKKPLARVVVVHLDSTNRALSGAAYFSQQPLSQTIKYLTEDGYLIDLDDPVSLFQIKLFVLKETKTTDIRIVKKDLVQIMQLSRYFHDSFHSSSAIDMTPGRELRVSSTTADEVIFSLRGDIAHQLGSLQALLNASTIDRKKIDSVDVRFGNPVVRFK